MRKLALALLAILAVVFSVIATRDRSSTAHSAPGPASACREHGDLPDRHCTPGVRDRHVTQANIDETICRTGYTTTVRPPSSYTTDLKRRQLAAYGYYDGHSLRSYEEDHLISLELGGSPRSPKNLWPEAHSPTPGSYQKDTVENYFHAQVCARRMTLATAQHEEASNWRAVYERIHR
jgi:hypothetical protein